MSVDINGLEVVLDRLSKFADTSNVEQAVKQATLYLEGEVAKKVPLGKTKELQQSIASRFNNLTGEVFTPLEYAPYVEYGTGLFATGEGGGRKEVPWVYVEGQGASGRAKTIHTEQSANEAVAFLREKGLEAYKTYGEKPQPFMRPALDENREQIVKILGRALIDD